MYQIKEAEYYEALYYVSISENSKYENKLADMIVKQWHQQGIHGYNAHYNIHCFVWRMQENLEKLFRKKFLYEFKNYVVKLREAPKYI